MIKFKRYFLSWGFIIFLGVFLTGFLYIFHQNYFAYQQHLLNSGKQQTYLNQSVKILKSEIQGYQVLMSSQPDEPSATWQENIAITESNITKIWKQIAVAQFTDTDLGIQVQQIGMLLSNNDLMNAELLKDVTHLQGSLTKWFWDYSIQRESQFYTLTRYRFFGMVAAAALLLIFGIVFVNRQRKTVVKEVALPVDETTGFFRPEVFDVLARKELDRAKRRGFGITFVTVHIDPIDQIKAELGENAASHLLFEVTQNLSKAFRIYDYGFHYNENTFVLLFTETDKHACKIIVDRVKGLLFQKSFMVDHRQTKVVPRIRIGVALYPHDAQELKSIVQHAMTDLSYDSDAEASKTETNDQPAAEKTDQKDYVTIVKAEKKADGENIDLWPIGKWEGFENKDPTLPIGSCDVVSAQAVVEDEEEEITEKTRRATLEQQAKLEAEKEKEVIKTEQEVVVEEGLLDGDEDEHSVVAYKTLENDYDIRNEKPKVEVQPAAVVKEVAVEPEQTIEVPEVVMALTQDSMTVPEAVEEAPKPAIERKNTQEDHGSFKDSLREINEKTSSFDSVPKSQDYDEINEITGITDIKVLQSDDDEDVIMVDFEREKLDLAQKFRRRQKRRRTRVRQ